MSLTARAVIEKVLKFQSCLGYTFTQVTSSLCSKCWTKHQVVFMDKYSNLFFMGVSDEIKRFIAFRPGHHDAVVEPQVLKNLQKKGFS